VILVLNRKATVAVHAIIRHGTGEAVAGIWHGPRVGGGSRGHQRRVFKSRLAHSWQGRLSARIGSVIVGRVRMSGVFCPYSAVDNDPDERVRRPLSGAGSKSNTEGLAGKVDVGRYFWCRLLSRSATWPSEPALRCGVGVADFRFDALSGKGRAASVESPEKGKKSESDWRFGWVKLRFCTESPTTGPRRTVRGYAVG